MPSRRATLAGIGLSAALLVWPALLNGYPLIFSDTGTYLSQAMELHLGWDKPPFYSFFLLVLDGGRTTWPVIVAQALLAAHTLHLVQRALFPRAAIWRLPALTAALSLGTALPWFTTELMPDLFTALMVITVWLMVFAPDSLGRTERWWLMLYAAGMIAVHQSNLPLALGLLVVLLPLRLSGPRPFGRPNLARVIAAPALAALAMIGVNWAGHGRPAVSPYGNVFILARMIGDGPGRRTLQRDCPHPGWRLCAFRKDLPRTADAFLWHADSPLYRAGGPVRVSAEANSIIWATLRAEPWTEARAEGRNLWRQLRMFATGHGLRPWRGTAGRTIARDLPRFEAAAFRAGLQARGKLRLPPWLAALHVDMALAGLALTLAGLLLGRPFAARGLCAAVLLAVLGNAAITGMLSGPHDRYQSRVMWLPAFSALLALPGLMDVAREYRRRLHRRGQPASRPSTGTHRSITRFIASGPAMPASRSTSANGRKCSPFQDTASSSTPLASPMQIVFSR